MSTAELIGEYWPIALEAVAVITVVLVILLAPEFATVYGRRLALVCRSFQPNNNAAILLAGLLVIALRSALWPWEGVPYPSVHDEYSYLLAADTFAAGRLTNPPHPMWVHFETIHVNQLPSYSSVYPPGQGLVLAIGKLLTGTPWAGVLWSCALMSAATCWMLQAWFPPPWPFIGAVLLTIRLCTFSYWINTYWGGAVAAIGGALLLGSLGRAIKRPKMTHGCMFALGLLILASTRPYEGLVFCLPLGIAVISMLAEKKVDRLIWLRRILIPLVVSAVVAFVASAYYNRRTTGDAFLMPHELNQQTYGIARPFVWQPARPKPIYHHKSMQTVYERFFVEFEHTRRFRGFLVKTCKKAARFWLFFIGPVFSVPMIVAPFAFRLRRARLLLWSIVAVLLACTVEVYFLPHYAAPATAALYGVFLTSMRHVQTWRVRGKRAGLLLAHVTPLICLAMLIVRALGQPLGLPFRIEWPNTWYYTSPGNFGRAEMLNILNNSGKRHLVIVRYGERHTPDDEWVYNEADIDRARVVWARDMGESKNRELVEYFRDREAWILEPDQVPLTLRRYTDVRP